MQLLVPVVIIVILALLARFFVSRVFSLESLRVWTFNWEARELAGRDKMLASISHWLWRRNITPNRVTILGIILSAVVSVLFWQGVDQWVIFIVAFLAVLTDLEGSLARFTHNVTPLGGFLDGLRDSMLAVILTLGVGFKGLIPISILSWLIISALAGAGMKIYEIFYNRQVPLKLALQKRFIGQGKLECDRLAACGYGVGLLSAVLVPYGVWFNYISFIGLWFAIGMFVLSFLLRFTLLSRPE